MAQKRPGAPSKWDDSFPDKLEAHLATGLSIEAFCGEVGISVDTFYRWEKVRPALSEAKKRGLAKSQSFWEKLGMAGMTGKIKNFNSAIWIFNMKNRFGWRDMPPDDAGRNIPAPTLNYAPRKKTPKGKKS